MYCMHQILTINNVVLKFIPCGFTFRLVVECCTAEQYIYRYSKLCQHVNQYPLLPVCCYSCRSQVNIEENITWCRQHSVNCDNNKELEELVFSNGKTRNYIRWRLNTCCRCLGTLCCNWNNESNITDSDISNELRNWMVMLQLFTNCLDLEFP